MVETPEHSNEKKTLKRKMKKQKYFTRKKKVGVNIKSCISRLNASSQ